MKYVKLIGNQIDASERMSGILLVSAKMPALKPYYLQQFVCFLLLILFLLFPCTTLTLSAIFNLSTLNLNFCR